MRNIAVIAAYAAVAIVVTGCGESAQDQAAKKIALQVDLARRHYLRAVVLLGQTPQPDKTNAVERTAERPKALAALKTAEQILTKAIAENTNATIIAKAPAYALLAEVQCSTGSYHGNVARAHIADAMTQMHVARLQLDSAEGVAALAGFFGKLAESDHADLLQLKQDALAERDSLSQRRLQIKLQCDDLNGQIQTLAQSAKSQQMTAAKLRDASRSARNMETLSLLTQAEQIEQGIDQNDQKLGELKFQVATAQDELQVVDTRLSSITGQIEALTKQLDALAVRSVETGAKSEGLWQEVQQVQTKLAPTANMLFEAFSAACRQQDLATKAYKQAASANDMALRGITKSGSDARKVMSDNPQSAFEPILASMSSRGELAGATARKGKIALELADLQRELLEATRHVQSLAGRIEKLSQILHLPVPPAIDQAAALVPDVAKLIEEAGQGYESAIKAYDEVAERLLERTPVLDNRATRWMYQTSKAFAMMGLYQLSQCRNQPDRTFLDQARELVNQILADHPERPYFLEPVYRLNRSIQAAG
ncbi:MAG: hypothetical protein HQ546_10945 [Planctomycetes bacterium]|nr:hypothetical protein [Planctomycetota bacterium]